MQITVTVDVSEFYSDEDGENFKDTIKNAIAYELKKEFFKEMKEEALKEFSKELKTEMAAERDKLIMKTLIEVTTEMQLKQDYNKNPISVVDWLTNEFKSLTLNDNLFKTFLSDHVKTFGTKMANELQDRYDILFTSQIVSSLNDKGLLREDVAKLLLNK